MQLCRPRRHHTPHTTQFKVLRLRDRIRDALDEPCKCLQAHTFVMGHEDSFANLAPQGNDAKGFCYAYWKFDSEKVVLSEKE